MKSYDLLEIEKESRGVFNADGLLYTSTGLLLLLVGTSFLFRPLLILVAFGALLILPLEAVRRRVTYPRLGYAKYKSPPGTARGIFIFAVISVIILTGIAFVGNGRFQQYLPFAFGIVFALAFYFGMSMQGLGPVDWLLIGAILITSLLASLLFTDFHDGAAASLIITGLLFIAFGLVKFAHFLRTTPLLDQDDLK